MIKLHTYLKRMVVKASVMGWSVEKVHNKIDEILDIYEVKNKLPKNKRKEAKENK